MPEIRLLVCDLVTIDKWWETVPCCNPHWRLYWNPQPGASVRHNRQTVSLAPDALVLVAPETTFVRACHTPLDHLYVHFTTGHPLDRIRPGIHRLLIGPETRRLLKRLLRLQRDTSTSLERSLLALSLVSRALAELPADIAHRADADPRITRTLTAMQSSITSPLPNAHLARMAGMAENSFIRLFTQTLGEPPQTYSLRIRLEQAALELHHTDLKLEVIAERHGFCDRYHLSRAFRRIRGESPAAYRRHARLQDRRPA